MSGVSPFLDPAQDDEPLARLARMRAEDPVHLVEPLGFWVILRHDDVKRMFGDEDVVTADRRCWKHHQPSPPGSFMHWFEEDSLFALAADEHARRRRLFSAALTPRAVRRYDEQVRKTVERFAAPLRSACGTIELMGSFAQPIPNAVMSRITGIPPAGDDERRFCALAQAVMKGMFPFADAEARSGAEAACLEMGDWVRSMTRARRESLREDLISDLIRAQVHDDRLTDDEILMTITSLIAAGSETTSIGGLLLARALMAYPEQAELLRREPRWIPNAVAEILRTSLGFGGPAGPPRFARRDFELRGKRIRKGQMLILAVESAGRDPAVFEDPDRFDVTRDPSENVSFGHGLHYCLGAHLARQEMAAMLQAMLEVVPPGARLRDDLLEYASMGPFRRPVNMPIEVRTAG